MRLAIFLEEIIIIVIFALKINNCSAKIIKNFVGLAIFLEKTTIVVIALFYSDSSNLAEYTDLHNGTCQVLTSLKSLNRIILAEIKAPFWDQGTFYHISGLVAPL